MKRSFWKRYRMARSLLTIIRDCNGINGRELREALWELGAKMGVVSFYHMMNQFEEKGMVVGWYQEYSRGCHTYWERCYRRPARKK